MGRGSTDAHSEVLTEKQEAFAVHYARTANAAEAYRQAYDVAENARDSWLYVEAAQLLDHPKISPRIKELRAQAEKHAFFTVAKAMEELEEARMLAMGESIPAAAISATNSKVKLLGYDKPQKHEVTGKDGEPLRSPSDMLAAFLASKSSGSTGEPSEE